MFEFIYQLSVCQYRVATNLENLEYSGISLNMENSGNSVQPDFCVLTFISFYFILLHCVCKCTVLKRVLSFPY